MSSSSIDTILEGLKQGNALEIEFVKKLKEGLTFIAESMQSECYNRSDALSEVQEKLTSERAKAHGHITANQKSVLASIIKINILRWKDAMDISLATYNKTIENSNATYEADKRSWEETLRQAEDEKKNINALIDMTNDIGNAKAIENMRVLISTWKGRWKVLQRQGERIELNRCQRADEANKKHVKKCQDFQMEVHILKSIATTAGIVGGDI